MTYDVQVPVAACAFDDPGTREALQQSWRRAFVRFGAWTVAWVVSLIVAGAFSDGAAAPVGVAAVVLVLVLLRPLALSAISLRCLRTIETVLRARPWEYRTSVRRHPTAKVRRGIAVQVKTGDGDDDWTPAMSARGPFRWRRWTGEMESGAWFSGDLARGGVLALPGGHGLMILRHP